MVYMGLSGIIIRQGEKFLTHILNSCLVKLCRQIDCITGHIYKTKLISDVGVLYNLRPALIRLIYR